MNGPFMSFKYRKAPFLASGARKGAFLYLRGEAVLVFRASRPRCDSDRCSLSHWGLSGSDANWGSGSAVESPPMPLERPGIPKPLDGLAASRVSRAGCASSVSEHVSSVPKHVSSVPKHASFVSKQANSAPTHVTGLRAGDSGVPMSGRDPSCQTKRESDRPRLRPACGPGPAPGRSASSSAPTRAHALRRRRWPTRCQRCPTRTP